MPEYACVDYKGFLDKNGMVALLEQANIGASTLLNVGQYDKIDTFPTKVYDYMSMELPVIISNTEYAKRINDKYHFGICVNPDNTDEICQAITWLKSHPNQAIEMGKNGRRAIEEEFNWEKESEKLIAFYKQL
jgi:glycosyltransferase involved in cell wall biosynthesis